MKFLPAQASAHCCVAVINADSSALGVPAAAGARADSVALADAEDDFAAAASAAEVAAGAAAGADAAEGVAALGGDGLGAGVA